MIIKVYMDTIVQAKGVIHAKKISPKRQKYHSDWYAKSGRKEKYQSLSAEVKDEMNAKRREKRKDPQKMMMLKHQNWKRAGIKFYDKESFNELYLSTHHCQICNKEITDDGRYNHPAKKVLDHDHESGYWRSICCHTCNTKGKPYDILRYRIHLDLHRYFIRNGMY
tara:strand:+ start:51 stop:548 length:498 start_codon:yes stop_codon:yes gene_type:complete